MASKRMFALSIVNSAKFLKLPIDAQNLYFHLGIRADDDGIVEAFPIMRLLGTPEDSLKLLQFREFIKILNEDLVCFITDFKIHNYIRADRKINSIHQKLLLESVPQVELIEPVVKKPKKKNNIPENVKLNSEQVDKLIERFGEEGTQKRIKNLSNYIEKNGDKYKNHFETIIFWEQNLQKKSKVMKSVNMDDYDPFKL